MSTSIRSRIVSRLGLIIACSLSLMPTERLLRAEEPRQWAVLIGVQEHDNKKYNLRYTENDVHLLRMTLSKRAGLAHRRSDSDLLMMPDGTPDRRPTLGNLRRELPAFLAKPTENDRVLVFFQRPRRLISGRDVPGAARL